MRKVRKTKLHLEAPNQLAATPNNVRIYEKFEPKNSAKIHIKNVRSCVALVREAP